MRVWLDEHPLLWALAFTAAVTVSLYLVVKTGQALGFNGEGGCAYSTGDCGDPAPRPNGV